MAIIGVDIDQLTPTSDTSGTVWLIIRRNGVDYKITKADFNSGNVGAAIPLWNASLIFNTTDNRFCVDPATNRFWRSKVDANQNNQPPQNPVTTEDDNWIEISPKESSAIKEWEPGWFFSDHVVVKRLGRLVELINPARPYDSVDIEAEIAGGDWRYIPIGAPTTGGAYQNTYASIPAMITGQGDQASGAVQFVEDASADFPAAGQGDPNVQTAGTWAEYIYLGTTNGDLTDYRKRAEQESMDKDSHFKGLYTSFAALEAAVPTASPGDYAIVDEGVGTDAVKYIWDDDDEQWVAGGGGGPVANASETLEGVVEEATQDETNDSGNTGTGSTGARLFVSVPKLWGWWTNLLATATGWLTNSHMADMPALSVKVRAANSTGVPTDLQATTADRLLARNASNVLAFVQATTNMILDRAVTLGKFVASPGNSVLAKIGSGSGDYAHTDIINVYDGIVTVTPTRILTADDDIDNGDHTILIDATSTAVTATLPDPETVVNQEFLVKLINATNSGFLDPDTFTIEGSSTDIEFDTLWQWVRVKAVQLSSSPTYGYIKIGGNV